MRRGATDFQRRACAVPGVLAVEADSRHAFARHTHDEFGIGVVERGAQSSASGRGQVQAGAGDVITVNPGEVHDGHPLDEGGRSWRMLYFAPPLIARAVGDIREGAPTGEFEFADPVLRDASMARRVRQLYLVCTCDDGAQALRGEELLLTTLAACAMQLATPAPRRMSWPLALARSRIDDDPAVPLTLGELADLAGLSRFQLVRAFAQTTGLTPHAYLVQRRLQLARRLIGAGMPLAEAASSSGFSDQSHLTRLFTRSFGMSPGAYAMHAAPVGGAQ